MRSWDGSRRRLSNVSARMDSTAAYSRSSSVGSRVDDSGGGPATTVASADFAAASESAGDGGGVDYSTTNVQEAGVDEPDIVKTDGEYLFVLVDNRLNVIDARPGAPELLDSMSFDEVYPTELILGDGPPLRDGFPLRHRRCRCSTGLVSPHTNKSSSSCPRCSSATTAR